jgi:hypothetical protein
MSFKNFEMGKDNTGQQISKTFCICDEYTYVITLFVCIYEVRKGT